MLRLIVLTLRNYPRGVQQSEAC